MSTESAAGKGREKIGREGHHTFLSVRGNHSETGPARRMRMGITHILMRIIIRTNTLKDITHSLANRSRILGANGVIRRGRASA